MSRTHTYIVLSDATGRARGLLTVPWGMAEVARRRIVEILEKTPDLVHQPVELAKQLPAQMLAEAVSWTDVTVKGTGNAAA